MTQPANRRLATEQHVADTAATKVNSSTYTAGLAGKQDAATLAADAAAHVTDGSVLDAALKAVSVAATIATGTSAFADFTAKADANMSDVHLLIVSDSTAAASGGWVDLAVPQLAARFPRHAISHARWTDGSPGSYAAPTVTAGTGARTIFIWNASVAGKTWQYHFDSTRWPTMLAANQPDAVYFSLGHNDNIAAVNSGNTTRQRGKALGYLETFRTMWPSARVVLGSQNPTTNYPASSQNRGDMLRQLAQTRGYGYVDVVQAFVDDGRTLAGTLISGDQTHPTTAGYAVWADRFMQEFPLRPTGRVPAQLPPLFGQQSINLLPDPTFAAYDGSTAPAGWTLVNLGHARNSSTFETGTGALALTKSAGGATARIERNLPVPLSLVRGRTVTVGVRIYVPGTPGGAGNVQVDVGDNTGFSGSEAGPATDQWLWLIVSGRIIPTATFARARLHVDTTTGATLPTVIVDRIGVWFGDLPYDPIDL